MLPTGRSLITSLVFQSPQFGLTRIIIILGDGDDDDHDHDHDGDDDDDDHGHNGDDDDGVALSEPASY